MSWLSLGGFFSHSFLRFPRRYRSYHRLSSLFIPTTRDVPSETILEGHAWLLRAGFVRASGAAGVYSLLPLGFRVLENMIHIVDDELHAIGCSRLALPSLQLSDAWRLSGRWAQMGAEMFRLEDRRGTHFCVAPTHEEEVTQLVQREIGSFRQLPVKVYQIGTKFRDEIRPRAGLIRGREFLMKDLYTFDADLTAAMATYYRVIEAYTRIFDRFSLPVSQVLADSGLIGGDLSHEFHMISPAGEDYLLICKQCGYSANREKAECSRDEGNQDGIPKLITINANQLQMGYTSTIKQTPLVQIVRTADQPHKPLAVAIHSIDRHLNIASIVKDIVAADVTLKDSSMSEIALPDYLASHPQREMAFEQLVALLSSDRIPLLVDPSAMDYLKSLAFTSKPISLKAKINVCTFSSAGDSCARCHGQLAMKRGIELGHAFLLGEKYTRPLEASFMADLQERDLSVKNNNNMNDNSSSSRNDNEDSELSVKQFSPSSFTFVKEKRYMQMGCYGLGISRILAALADYHHDEKGLCWPGPVAPYRVCVIYQQNHDKEDPESSTNSAKDLCLQLDTMANAIGWKEHAIVLDDRVERLSMSYRLREAEMVGYPWLLIIGRQFEKSGKYEIENRRTRQKYILAKEELQDFFKTHA